MDERLSVIEVEDSHLDVGEGSPLLSDKRSRDAINIDKTSLLKTSNYTKRIN